MRVLVTGGTGFIGSRVVERLARRGHATRCLVRPICARGRRGRGDRAGAGEAGQHRRALPCRRENLTFGELNALVHEVSGVALPKIRMPADASKSARELGLTYTPIRAAIEQVVARQRTRTA